MAGDPELGDEAKLLGGCETRDVIHSGPWRPGDPGEGRTGRVHNLSEPRPSPSPAPRRAPPPRRAPSGSEPTPLSQLLPFRRPLLICSPLPSLSLLSVSALPLSAPPF